MTEQDSSPDRYRLAEEHLQAGRFAEGLEELQIAEAIEKVERQKRAALRKRTIANTGLVTVLALSLGLLIKIPATDIILSVESNGFDFTSAHPGETLLLKSTIESTGIRIADTDYFDALPIGHPALLRAPGDLPASGDIKLMANSITLGDLTVTPANDSTSFTIDQYQSNIDIYTDAKSLSGHIDFHLPSQRPGAFTATIDGIASPLNTGVNSEHSQTRYFRTRPQADLVVPRSIQLLGVDSLSLVIENLSTAEFSRQYPPGSGKTQSTVLAGNLVLLDTGEEIEIRADESLDFECRDCTQHAIFLEKDRLRFTLRGSVEELNWGYRERQSNQVPSVLEYLYLNQKIAMLWGAVLFIYGFIWRFKRHG